MEKAFRTHGEKIEFLAVSQDDMASIEGFIRKFRLSVPVARDADKRLSKTFHARMPTYILIDASGIIRYMKPFIPEERDIEGILK